MKVAMKTLTVLLASSIVATPALAEEAVETYNKGYVTGTWSNIDPNPDQKKVGPLTEHKAWETDMNGNVTPVEPLDKLGSRVEAGTEMWSDSDYNYYWDHYEPWYNDTDLYHFFVGSVSYANYSSLPQSMSYSQQETKTTSWTFTGKVSMEASFGNAVIGNAKYAGGFDVARSVQTTSSSTVLGSATVAPNTRGTLSLYDAGAYSGGAGVWKKYTKSGTMVGTYNETGAAWAVATNNKNFIYREAAI